MTVTMTNDDDDDDDDEEEEEEEEEDPIVLQVGPESLSDLGPMGTVMGTIAVRAVITKGVVRTLQ